MGPITGTVIGAENVSLRFHAISQGAHGKMLQLMGTVSTNMSTYVKDNKLSGQVLQVRSGRLRRSINGTTQDAGTQISAVVRTNVRYARAQEQGCDKTVQVPTHTRMHTMAWGRPIAARMVEVRAHSMHMNLKPRSFMVSSLREDSPTEIAYIRREMAVFCQETRS